MTMQINTLFKVNPLKYTPHNYEECGLNSDETVNVEFHRLLNSIPN